MSLFIAILAANFAAVVCFSSGWYGGDFQYALNLWGALAIGQVSLIAVWLAFRDKHDWHSMSVPVLALAGASYIRLQLNFFPGFGFLDFICRNALQGLVSLVVLWPLVRTNLWRQLGGHDLGLRLEFSIKQLLFWMTSVAVFATLLGRTTWQNGRPLAATEWMGLLAPGLVAIGVVVVSQQRIGWWWRLAIDAGLGAMVGFALDWLGSKNASDRLAVEFAAQALVVAIGVEVGGFAWRRGAFPLQ
jgi:hypothetical protein